MRLRLAKTLAAAPIDSVMPANFSIALVSTVIGRLAFEHPRKRLRGLSGAGWAVSC